MLPVITLPGDIRFAAVLTLRHTPPACHAAERY